MGVVVDRLKGRKTNHVVDDLQPVEQLPKNSQTDGPSANLGLSEKDAQPEGVSQEAPIGVQKAEAAALVWSKKAIYGTYAWYGNYKEAYRRAVLMISSGSGSAISCLRFTNTSVPTCSTMLTRTSPTPRKSRRPIS